MAQGITSNATTIFLEDNNHADAGGDGSISFADISTKLPADCLDVATALAVALPFRLYVFKKGLQLGDGTLTNATTLKDSDCIVVFVNTRTYVVANNGGSAAILSRKTEFGIRINGSSGKPSGRNGVDMYTPVAPTWRGTVQVFGSKLKTIGNMIFQPGAGGSLGALINDLLEATGTLGYGTTAGELSEIYNVDAAITGATSSLVQFNCLTAERLTITAPNSSIIISTAGQVRCKDMVMIGNNPSQTDLRNVATGPWQLVNHTFTQAGAVLTQAAASNIELWYSWNVRVTNGITGSPLANKRVQLKSLAGLLVVDAATDSEGQLTYGGGLTQDCVMVLIAISNSLVFSDLGPFTIVVNDRTFADYDSTMEEYTRTFTWPGYNYTVGANTWRQPVPFFDAVALGPPPASAPLPATLKLENVVLAALQGEAINSPVLSGR
jgi:hypothetical protein